MFFLLLFSMHLNKDSVSRNVMKNITKESFENKGCPFLINEIILLKCWNHIFNVDYGWLINSCKIYYSKNHNPRSKKF